MLELSSAAVTVSYYVGYGIGTLIYDVWGTHINNALEQVLPYQAAASGAQPMMLITEIEDVHQIAGLCAKC